MPITRQQAKMDEQKVEELLRKMLELQETKRQQEKQDEEARRLQEKQDEEARRQQEKQDEEARRQQEKQDEETRRLQEKQDEEARRLQEKQDEEARRQQEEARRQQEKQDEEARRQQEKQEEEARRQQEEARRQQEEAKRQQERQEDLGRLQKIFQTIQGTVANLDQKIEQVKDDVQEVKHDVQEVKAEVKTDVQQLRQEVEDQVQALEEKMRRLEIQSINSASVGAFSSMRIKPPTFDGSTSWTMYIRQFEAAANTNGWNDQEKATALIVALREPALDLLQSIPSIYQQNYQHLSQTLELRFGDHYRQEVFRTQVKSRVQKPDESLQEFESEVKRLVSLAFPAAGEDMQEWMAVSAFIDGLRDLKIQENLRMSKFRQSSEALVRALELEAIFGASRPRIRAVSIEDPKDKQLSKEDGSFETKMSNFMERMEKLLLEDRKMGNDSRQTPTPRNRIECYRCHKLGHIQRDCRVRMSSPSRDRFQRFSRSRDASPNNRQGNEN
nr:hypothetical protein [Rickettsia endosymbiont of Ceutorhynchus assimilis]